MKKFFFCLILLFITASLHAATEQAAYKVARTVIPPEHQKQVLSFYGKGTASEIKTWFVKFFDPAAKSNARIVVVEGGKVERSNTAEGQDDNEEKLTFDPSSCRAGVDKALKTAAKYTKESLIPVDSTRVYLNRPSAGKAPVWTVELWHQNRQQGYIYANTKDGGFAGYRPPTSDNRGTEKSEKSAEKKSNGAPEEKDSDTENEFGQKVKSTMLEIGGDLEEFFTGERTVDKDED